MGVKITNKSSVRELKNVIRELSGYAVEVGIFGSDEYVMIARVHEFGTTIRTKKASIDIPERSFLRSTFDEKEKEWFNFVKKRIPQILNSSMNARTLCEQLGAKMVADIQKKITDLDSPPNAPSTIAQKGSSNPLIDTGGLRMRVTYRVVSV